MAGSLIDANPGVEPEAVADARRLGFAADQIALIAAQFGLSSDRVSVWSQNELAVLAFLVGATQWRTELVPIEGGLRRRWIGLDYAGVKISIDASGLTIDAADWSGLRVIELAARDALNGESLD